MGAEDLITRYRGTTALLKRTYRDQAIRHAAVAISTAIKKAVFQGYGDLALNLATVLQEAEPLEERTALDGTGTLIIVAYTYYVLRDQAEALRIVKDVSTRFPDDVQLRRIVQMLST